MVYDRLTMRIAEVPASPDGKALRLALATPAISADGNYLVFAASPASENEKSIGLFHYDRLTGEVAAIGGTSFSEPGEIGFALSADGRWLEISQLGEGHAIELSLYDRLTDKTDKLLALGPAEDIDLGTQSPPAISSDGALLVFAGMPAAIAGEILQPDQQQVFALERSGLGKASILVAGWVSDGAGHPLPGVALTDNFGHKVKTSSNGDFRLELPTGKGQKLKVRLQPEQKGVLFSPAKIELTLSPGSLAGIQMAFSASPADVLTAAQQEIGMPYGQERGCPSPFRGCDGPFHGFYRGDCADLVLDAYREGINYNLQLALERDFWNEPSHYYRWRNSRNTQDMWRFFAYNGMILPNSRVIPDRRYRIFRLGRRWDHRPRIDHLGDQHARPS